MGYMQLCCSFVPQGEESYGYILETLAQSRYFG